LILANASAKYLAADDYPIGMPPTVAEALLAQLDQLWGTEALVEMTVPSRAGDARFRRWYARFQRTIASPRAFQAFVRASFELDARPMLPLVQVPTLILHRRDFPFTPTEHGRYLAEHIPGAKLIELPGIEGSLRACASRDGLPLRGATAGAARRHSVADPPPCTPARRVCG
jgi:pimeloyl-ACP methyl ester carboxylesterase